MADNTYKILSNIDLSTNEILNVTTIQGPNYDEGKAFNNQKLTLKSTNSNSIETEDTAKVSEVVLNPETINITSDSIYVSSPNTDILSDNIFLGKEDKEGRDDAKSKNIRISSEDLIIIADDTSIKGNNIDVIISNQENTFTAITLTPEGESSINIGDENSKLETYTSYIESSTENINTREATVETSDTYTNRGTLDATLKTTTITSNNVFTLQDSTEDSNKSSITWATGEAEKSTSTSLSVEVPEERHIIDHLYTGLDEDKTNTTYVEIGSESKETGENGSTIEEQYIDVHSKNIIDIVSEDIINVSSENNINYSTDTINIGSTGEDGSISNINIFAESSKVQGSISEVEITKQENTFTAITLIPEGESSISIGDENSKLETYESHVESSTEKVATRETTVDAQDTYSNNGTLEATLKTTTVTSNNVFTLQDNQDGDDKSSITWATGRETVGEEGEVSTTETSLSIKVPEESHVVDMLYVGLDVSDNKSDTTYMEIGFKESRNEEGLVETQQYIDLKSKDIIDVAAPKAILNVTDTFTETVKNKVTEVTSDAYKNTAKLEVSLENSSITSNTASVVSTDTFTLQDREVGKADASYITWTTGKTVGEGDEASATETSLSIKVPEETHEIDHLYMGLGGVETSTTYVKIGSEFKETSEDGSAVEEQYVHVQSRDNLKISSNNTIDVSSENSINYSTDTINIGSEEGSISNINIFAESSKVQVSESSVEIPTQENTFTAITLTPEGESSINIGDENSKLETYTSYIESSTENINTRETTVETSDTYSNNGTLDATLKTTTITSNNVFTLQDSTGDSKSSITWTTGKTVGEGDEASATETSLSIKVPEESHIVDSFELALSESPSDNYIKVLSKDETQQDSQHSIGISSSGSLEISNGDSFSLVSDTSKGMSTVTATTGNYVNSISVNGFRIKFNTDTNTLEFSKDAN